MSPPVNSPNQIPRMQHKYPKKIYKVQRIPPLIKNFIFFANRNTLKSMSLMFKAVVNTGRGLLASRRVFCWLPLAFFCSWSTKADSYGNEKLKPKWPKSVGFFGTKNMVRVNIMAMVSTTSPSLSMRGRYKNEIIEWK